MAVQTKYIISGGDNDYFYRTELGYIHWVTKPRQASQYDSYSQAEEEINKFTSGIFQIEKIFIATKEESIAEIDNGELYSIQEIVQWWKLHRSQISFTTESIFENNLPRFEDKQTQLLFTRATIRKWEEKLKAYLQENLRRIGINFENDVEFLHICQNNIKRVSFQDKPNYHEFYYGGIGKEDIYLGSYSDKIETINEGSRVTMIIGKELE